MNLPISTKFARTEGFGKEHIRSVGMVPASIPATEFSFLDLMI